MLRIADSADTKLWLDTSETTGLPSRRAERRGKVKVASASVASLVVVVLVWSFMMAPDIVRVADPEAEGRNDFSVSVAALSINETLGAVLMAVDRGATFASGTPTRRDIPFGTPRPLSRGHARVMLQQVQQPTRAYSGQQDVTVLTGQGYLTGTVKITEVPDAGATVSVIDAADNTFMSGFVPSMITPELPNVEALDFEFCTSGCDMVAGVPVAVLQARWRGALVARWWIDAERSLILRSERYDATGQLLLSSGFSEIDYTPRDARAEVTSRPLVGAMQLKLPTESRGTDWCVGLDECPDELAGLPLVAYSSSERNGDHVMKLVYSDGIVTMTVLRQPGFLAPGGQPARQFKSLGMPSVVAWQSGDAVMVVATNGAAAQLSAASEVLPHDDPASPGVGWQLSRGFSRLVGSAGR